MENHAVIDFAFNQIHCNKCGLFQFCLPIGNFDAESEQFNRINRQTRMLERGEHLFRKEDSFKAIYAIRTGSIKTYTSIDNGKEQVIGLHLAGN